MRPFYNIILLSAYLITGTLWGQQTDSIQSYLDSLSQDISIALLAQEPSGNILFQHQPRKQVPAASVIKIPILMTLFRQIEAGNLHLDQTYILQEEDKVAGSGELQHEEDGSAFTLEYLAKEMIRISDNTATNILIKLLSMRRINQTMNAFDLETTQLNRLMMDFEAIAAGRQNYTSPTEINKLLRIILSGTDYTPDSRQAMLNMLLACEDRSAIPSQLPEGIRIAHKTGTLDYVRGDAGIILTQSPIVLSIFVENFDNIPQAEKIIGDLSRLIFEAFGSL